MVGRRQRYVWGRVLFVNGQPQRYSWEKAVLNWPHDRSFLVCRIGLSCGDWPSRRPSFPDGFLSRIWGEIVKASEILSFFRRGITSLSEITHRIAEVTCRDSWLSTGIWCFRDGFSRIRLVFSQNSLALFQSLDVERRKIDIPRCFLVINSAKANRFSRVLCAILDSTFGSALVPGLAGFSFRGLRAPAPAGALGCLELSWFVNCPTTRLRIRRSERQRCRRDLVQHSV